MTLPETTLHQLADIDSDRARAIVKAARIALDVGNGIKGMVQVVDVAPSIGLIIVGPSRYMGRIPWLRMVEIAPARFLLSIPPGMSADAIELAIGDLLDDVPESEQRERVLLVKLRDLMRDLRREQKVSKEEILLVSTGKKNRVE